MQDTSRYAKIAVDQLRVGLYVVLDLKWMDHPFLTNSFKIRNAREIDTLRRMGLSEVRYCPLKSDCEPAPHRSDAKAPSAPQISEEELAAIKAKRARIERLQRHKQSVQQCERELLKAATAVKEIQQNLFARPRESVQTAVSLITQLADSLLTDKEVAIHAMNDKIAGEDVYHHTLNVTILAMMLAKGLEMPRHEISLLGLGCLFHDIGKSKVPDSILRKTTPLTKAEKSFMTQHPVYGNEIGLSLNLPKPALDIIRHHHEHVDGSGYPDRLNDASMSKLAKITAIIDAYDILCNHVDPNKSLTPFEAISTMFAKQRAFYNAQALGLFIRMLGVYPPGTVVQLSNEMWGLVVSVNVNRSVKPNVLVYDPEVPKEEAIILDLESNAELDIARTCRPGQLPREAYDYLSPRRRMTYFFGETESPAQHG